MNAVYPSARLCIRVLENVVRGWKPNAGLATDLRAEGILGWTPGSPGKLIDERLLAAALERLLSAGFLQLESGGFVATREGRAFLTEQELKKVEP